MKIQRHIFGSRKGYQTLAVTAGLDPRSRRRLESFAFGQTGRADYLDSLATRPAFVCRALDYKTFAVTRVLPGGPDDNGRATLLLVSAVLDTHEWICTLGGDPGALLSQDQLWQWAGQQTLSTVFSTPHRLTEPALDGSAAKQVATLLSVIERAIASGQRVVVPNAPGEADQVFRATLMLLPDQVKDLVSSAYRALNPEMPVDFSWLAEGVSPSGGAEIIIHRLTDETPLTPYAIQLIRSGLADGRIAWDIVRTYQNFGLITEESEPTNVASDPTEPTEPAEANPATSVKPKRIAIGKLAKSAAMPAVLAIAAGAVLGIGIGISFNMGTRINHIQPNMEKNQPAADPKEVSIVQQRNLILGRIILNLDRSDESQIDSAQELRELIERLRKIDPVAAELADLAWKKTALTGELARTK